MEKFKRIIKKKLIFSIIMCLLFLISSIALTILHALNIFKAIDITLVLGSTIGCSIVFLVNVIRFKKALTKEENLTKFYIKETDERTAFIESKTFSSASATFFMVLFAIGIIYCYIDISVFFSICETLLIFVLLLIIFKAYYNKKY